jgi:hypothetical protein
VSSVPSPSPRDINETCTVAQAQPIFDETFLSIRAKLIEVAATLDRIDRAAAADRDTSGAVDSAEPLQDDPRRERVEEAISLLLRGATAPGERARRLQQLFSRPYEPAWREQFGL